MPLVTTISSPAIAASTATWMFRAAVAQLVKGSAGLRLFGSTYRTVAKALPALARSNAAAKSRATDVREMGKLFIVVLMLCAREPFAHRTNARFQEGRRKGNCGQ